LGFGTNVTSSLKTYNTVSNNKNSPELFKKKDVINTVYKKNGLAGPANSD
jgi:hypothetical protein